ncbi:MAG: hypothetical protein IJO26_04460 [Clostridium sp.]|nr:hypothetical protein [Clostridium sp.]
MSKCPFWSTSKKGVNCYKECPMNFSSDEDEICPFKEFLSLERKTSVSDNLSEDLYYSQERFLGYDEDERVISY